MKRLLRGSSCFRAALAAAAAAVMVAGAAHGQCDPALLGTLNTTDFASGVAVSGTIAYVADGSDGLQVIDVSDPTTPTLLGTLAIDGNSADVAVNGTTAYVADDAAGLRVIDVSDPTTPVLLGTLGSFSTLGVAVSGTIAYVADGPAGLQVVDVSDPMTPTVLGTLDTVRARGVAVSGTTAYVADDTAGLQVIDVSDPTTPTLLGTFNTAGQSFRVAVSGTIAYVADAGAGLQVIDVANPAAPMLLGTLNTTGAAFGVTVSGTTAYVADAGAGLLVIDVANPAAPMLLGTLDTTGVAVGVAVSGTIAYVADGTSGLQVIDASSCVQPGVPCDPALLGTLNTTGLANGVAVSGTTAYVASGGLQVIDVADPTLPVLLGTLTGGAVSVAVSGTTAYVADGNGLQVIDVADPTLPLLLGSLNTTGTARDVAVSGTTAYVADGNDGLQVINVADPTLPVLLGTLITTGFARGVAVSGTTAYLADGDLRVIDVADPTLPVLLGTLNTTGNARDIAVSGTTAYVADFAVGLQVIDVADPTVPVLLGTLMTFGFAQGVAVSGTTAYMADEDAGLRVIDVADPTLPVLLGTFNTSGFAQGVAVSGTTAYLADGFDGLRVIDVQCGECCFCDGTCMELAASACLATGNAQKFTPGSACADVTCVAVEDPVLITGPTLVCPGTQDIDYSVTNPNPNATYAWVLGGNGATVDGATNQPTVRVDAVNQCSQQFTLTVTCTAGDCVTTGMITVAVDDTTPPAAPANPAGMTVQCLGDEGDASLVMMTAQDNCAGDITVGGVDGPLVGDACGGTITRTWTFTDACNNTSVTTQIITIDDTMAPVAPADPPGLPFQCLADVPAPGMMTATDNCDGAITVTGADTNNGGAGCAAEPLVITRTWTFTDACNNTSATTQIITVIDDTMPTIDCPELIVVSCADGPPPPNPGAVTADDNCGVVNVTHVSDVDSNPGCPRTVTRTYRATDPCGNFADCTQAILVDRLHPGWNWVDNGITLTANEPTYWSALTGEPKGVSPFTVLDPGFPPGRPAMDGSGDRVLRGYVIAWAVDQFGDEIRWNHLKGEGTIVNYRDTASWEYNTWNHAVVANVANGEALSEPGVLRLDGAEYSLSFDELLLNFQAAGSDGFSAPAAAGFAVESETDLTLFPPAADLRQNSDGPVTTKASFDIWNENETKFSGTHRCITCWDQTLLSRYDTPNHFLYPFLQTDHGKTRIDGHAANECNVLDDPETPEDESVTSIFSPLLGVYARHLEINGASTASSGSNLVGLGTDDTAVIRYDAAGGGGGPPEGQMPTDPVKLIDWLVRIAESRTALPRIDEAADVEHNEAAALSGIGQDRVSGTEKGSLLFFSKVELRWGGPPAFPLIQDTFLSITNDFPKDVRVQMYFVNGDAPITATPGGP